MSEKKNSPRATSAKRFHPFGHHGFFGSLGYVSAEPVSDSAQQLALQPSLFSQVLGSAAMASDQAEPREEDGRVLRALPFTALATPVLPAHRICSNEDSVVI